MSELAAIAVTASEVDAAKAVLSHRGAKDIAARRLGPDRMLAYGPFDVIVANILQETLIDLAPDIEARLSPGGWLGLSGISPAQISRLSAAFPNTRIVATLQLDDWCAIVGERSPA